MIGNDLCHRVINLAREYGYALETMGNASKQSNSFDVRYISWQRHPNDWIKVNMDDSMLVHNGTAACGGLIRNHDGHFIVAFLANLGSCFNMLAELWGAYWGLHLSWGLGFRKVILEVNSASAVEFILNGIFSSHVCFPLTLVC